MCNECTWHHKTFLLQLSWHLAIKLYSNFYTLLRLSFPMMTTTKWHISYVRLTSLIANLQACLLVVSPTPETDLGTNYNALSEALTDQLFFTHSCHVCWCNRGIAVVKVRHACWCYITRENEHLTCRVQSTDPRETTISQTVSMFIQSCSPSSAIRFILL